MDKERMMLFIDVSTPLVEALRRLNDTGKRIVFLVENRKLKGTLTYGDVSRWILKGNSLDAPAKEAATMNPASIHIEDVPNAEKKFSEVSRLYSGSQVIALPVLDDEDNVVDIIFQEKERKQYGQINIPIVIMAGGKGTRLYPYTKILPKPLIPIGEIPISEHIVNRFYENGCQEFFFIVNYKKNMIKAYYNELNHPYTVHFVDENTPLGTGGGLSLMKGMINNTFVLTNCDSIIEEDYSKILKVHKDKHNLVTMICSNQKYEVPYGVIDTNEDGDLIAMREKPSLKYLTNTGTYIVEPEVIDMIEPGISIGFPDIIQKVKDADKKVGIYIVGGNSWLDMGQFDAMDEMKKRLNIKD